MIGRKTAGVAVVATGVYAGFVHPRLIRWGATDNRPSAYMEGLWGFQLNELPGGHSRLVIGGYQAVRP